MAATHLEVAFSSDGTGQLWNSCAWDVKTGTIVATFRGGISGAKSLSLVGDSYLISAQKEKPLLQAWSLNSKDQQQMRITCPGRVSVLSISKDGEFCAAAIEEKFHLWQVSDGTLLAVVARHFQPISCLKFSDDGSCIFSAGEDGLVMLWFLSSLLEEYNNPLTSSHLEPEQLWSDHTLSVSDICIGKCSSCARFVTVSSDMTVQMYELSSGRLLVSFVLDVAATVAAMDPTEYNLFVGGVDGKIYQIGLNEHFPSQNVHFGEDEKMGMAFLGHSKQVTSLSVSCDGTCLLSASYDTTARFWHISSKQCLRVFQHKGAVLNAFLAIAPQSLLSTTPIRPRHALSTSFQRTRGTGEENAVSWMAKSSVDKISHVSLSQVTSMLDFRRSEKQDEKILPGQSKTDLLEENEKLRTVNHQLYNYSVQSIFGAFDV